MQLKTRSGMDGSSTTGKSLRSALKLETKHLLAAEIDALEASRKFMTPYPRHRLRLVKSKDHFTFMLGTVIEWWKLKQRLHFRNLFQGFTE